MDDFKTRRLSRGGGIAPPFDKNQALAQKIPGQFATKLIANQRS
jgi:hypothetical protein